MEPKQAFPFDVSSSHDEDYYDYYVSTYGDKRRCLYHHDKDTDGIVYDEPVAEGSFFPNDYYVYSAEEGAKRSRTHMVNGKAVNKESADFADPFASSYDIVSYNDKGERILTHYENGRAMYEKRLDEVSLSKAAPFVYKDASGHYEKHGAKIAAKPFKKLAKKKAVPFAIRLKKAPEETLSRYNEVRSALLSYRLVERLSIPRATYSAHRKACCRIGLGRKILKVYLALEPKDYLNSPIPHEDVSDKKTYASTPLLVRLTSPLAVRRAISLIEEMTQKNAIAKKK